MIRIFEVGPRDGLQNLPHIPKTEDKIQLVKLLREAGLEHIEIASFVHPKVVPNMADSKEVCEAFDDKTGLSVLVPNKKGLDRAKEVGINKYNIFFSPLDEFNEANYGLKLDQIIDNYKSALEGIPKNQVRVYLSEYFGCPTDYLEKAVKVGLEFGDRLVLCDTKGVATPFEVSVGIQTAQLHTQYLSVHLHHGKYLMDNVEVSYREGVREFDASVGGLGGCPFVEESGANLATEDLIKWCNKKGIDCGVELKNLKPAMKLAYKIKNPTIRVAIRNKLKDTKNLLKYKAGLS